MTQQPGPFIWYELLTNDVEAAIAFYGKVVGWGTQDSGMPGMDHRMWLAGDVAIGGVMSNAPPVPQGTPPIWLGYAKVDDVDATLAAMTAAGGTVFMPSMDLAQVGRMALVSDPQGALIHVMTPESAAPSRAHAPGTPGHAGWHELHTTDGVAALAFYGTHLGWGKSDVLDMGPMGQYRMFNAGGEAIGGMMNSPAFPQPIWLYYFNVADIDAAKARLEEAGGTVLMGPHEVPGGQRVIQAKDPQGAIFALITLART